MRVVVFQIFACLIFLIFDKCRLTTAAFSFISKAENGLSQNHYHHRRTLQKRAIPALRSKPKFIPKPDVQSYTIHADIKYRFATTTIFSRVANPADIAQEVSFTVTIPDSAFISEFLLIANDKTYKAEIREKNEAKETYDEAKKIGQTAGHVHLNDRDSNIFKVSVNVEAKSNVAFNLTYEQLLQRTLGFYENLLNINPGQVVEVLDVIVNIEESTSLRMVDVLNLKRENDQIEVTPHKNAIISRPENKAAEIRWNPTLREQEDISVNGMKGILVVRYDIDRQVKSNQMLIAKRVFVHFIAPENLQILPKYLIFVLDISGSMTPKRLNQLKTAMDQILTDMREGDYFSLILFSNTVSFWSLNGIKEIPNDDVSISKSTSDGKKIESEFIIRATQDNIYAAIDFINNLGAGLSTNMIGALRSGIRLARLGRRIHAKHEPIMFFLTDGEPNEGESDWNVIIKKTSTLNSNVKCSIFSLAFGFDTNFKYLDRLSKSNGGFGKQIYVASDTATQLTDFFKQISSPLMSNISVKYDPKQVQDKTVTKTKFSNYFGGSELIVAGKISADNRERKLDALLNANYTAIDKSTAATISQLEKIVVDGKSSSDSGPLERLWAFLRVKQLLDQDKINDAPESALKDEALDLSLKYSFVTPLTSLIVVKPNETTYVKIKSANDKAAIVPPGQGGYNNNRHHGGYHHNRPHGGHHANRPQVSYSVTNASTDLDWNAATTFKPATYPVYTRATTASPTILKPDGYSIDDLKWLNRTVVDKISLPNSKYVVNIKEPNLPHGVCKSLKNTSGYCRHLRYCVFADIVNNVNDYLTYHCVINGTYAGVCCPDKF